MIAVLHTVLKLRTGTGATSICLQNVFNSGIRLLDAQDSCTSVVGVSQTFVVPHEKGRAWLHFRVTSREMTT